jgi:Ala-tRNA(Pro) deacylase
MKLDEYLTNQQVPFERLPHRTAYTANRIAQLLHVPGKEMAKSVLLRSKRGYILAVLPATCQVDLAKVETDVGDNEVSLASEAEMEQIFTDCERGAIPPFGSQYRVTTVVDDSLATERRIVFEGQNHEEAIRMAFRDYISLEHPRVGHFACRM